MENFKKLIGELVGWYYDYHSTGGSLHIVLDDGNVDDGDIKFCREYAEEQGDTMAMFLCDLLSRFTEQEREDLFNNNWGKG